MPPKAPGAKWILILGVTGFAAGFIGPLVFVPEANQGPLVGIFISGPAGFMLGLVLWGASALIKLPARIQWRLLYTVASIGVLVTLVCVQPQPALLGYVYDAEVQSCSSPPATEESVIDDWNERIEKYDYAKPRAGWQDDMHRMLRDAPGVVVSVRLLRKNPILENRKPWNRGRQFASGWMTQAEETIFYDADGSCDEYHVGDKFRGFQKHDYEERIHAPGNWPPSVLIDVLGASLKLPVPQRWSGL